MILSPEQEEILADFDKYMDKIKVKAREALTERKPLEHYINNAQNYGMQGFRKRDISAIEMMVINSLVVSYAVRKSNSL